MSNILQQHAKLLAAGLAGAMLVACATSGDARRPPNYAAPASTDAYRVNCWDTTRRELYVRYDMVDTFYHPDGTVKTQQEFCDETPYGRMQRRGGSGS